jgi:hypothetical protein
VLAEPGFSGGSRESIFAALLDGIDEERRLTVLVRGGEAPLWVLRDQSPDDCRVPDGGSGVAGVGPVPSGSSASAARSWRRRSFSSLRAFRSSSF